MRIVTIDNGNSHPTVGIFENEKLSYVIELNQYQTQENDFILISDVGSALSIKPSFDLKKKRHSKDHPFFFEMPVHYSDTLGDDRLYLAYSLFKAIPDNSQSVLAIDAGTFITIDLINAKGFQGGFIFPGVDLFLSSYKSGAKLPKLDSKEMSSTTLPHSTEEAILMANNLYIENILESIIKKTSPSKIVITGGSSEFIKNKIEKLNLEVQLETVHHSIHLALFLIFQHHLRSTAL